MKKRLFITGGCGFIGHHLVEGVLKQTDWDIVVLDALTYAGNLNRLIDISIWEENKHRVKFIWHDLKAPISELTHKLIGDLDYVWHLAAESHVDRSLEDPIPFIESNVVGTTQLLKYVKEKQPNLKRFIYFGTDEVFGPAPEGVFYKEGDVCNPSNPYSASKEGAEAISKAFAFSFGLPITITRTMNVFGERQHPEKFIPKTIRAILDGDKVVIHGTPEVGFSSRCWIHAREVCNAMCWITENGEFIKKEKQFEPAYGIYHIVGEERSVLDLAQKIAKIIRRKELIYDLPEGFSEIEFVDFHKTRPGHDLRYALSGEKLRSQGFKYWLTLDKSFEIMVEWMTKEENKKWLNL